MVAVVEKWLERFRERTSEDPPRVLVGLLPLLREARVDLSAHLQWATTVFPEAFMEAGGAFPEAFLEVSMAAVSRVGGGRGGFKA